MHKVAFYGTEHILFSSESGKQPLVFEPWFTRKKKKLYEKKKKLSKFKYWFIRKNNKSKKKSMWSYVASTHDSN